MCIRDRQDSFQSQSPHRGTNEEEFFAVRQWQTGDSRRHIHWRSTAKVGQPMVRQFESHSPETLFVAVDLYADPHNISNSLEPDAKTKICEDMLSLLATLLHQQRGNSNRQLTVGIADDQASIHTANRDLAFTETLHQRLATATPCRNTAIIELLQRWTTEVSDTHELLVLSSRAMPEEISDLLQMSELSWLHCTQDRLESLFTGAAIQKRIQMAPI